MSMFLGLVLLLASTPGPLDRYGGHADPVTNDYHFHTGPSFRLRYIDASGQIFVGNSPLPDENLAIPEDSSLWTTPFLFYTIGAALGTGFLAWWIEDRLRHRRPRRRHHRHHPSPPLRRIA